MRAGLRLQILVLLGGLLVLAFVPLYAAVATYTSVALQQLRTSHAQSLGRAIGLHVSEARAHASAERLAHLLAAEVRAQRAEAILVYDAAGRVVAQAGDEAAVAALRRRFDRGRAATFELGLPTGRALGVVVPTPGVGGVAVLLTTDDPGARAQPLLRLVALYTALMALALLLLAYFALTRLIVRPLDELSRAAERVAGGARSLALPSTRVRELSELARSLRAMTERLLSEEGALRRKIEEVEAATVGLREAQDRLVRSERLASVGRLAVGLAHEIGNPIAALIGLLDLVLAGGLEPEEERDFLQRMRRESERIHRILRDLLQFARPSAELPSERGAPGDVAAAAQDTAALVAPQRDMKGVELRLELELSLPRVAMPHEQLMQVVLNLVLNAADAANPGGHVVVAARALPAGVELSVTDDGPGVAVAVRQRLFEPFVTTKEVGKGTGLGLAVCRGLVEAVGGSILLDETYEAGARFVVVLPKALSN